MEKIMNLATWELSLYLAWMHKESGEDFEKLQREFCGLSVGDIHEFLLVGAAWFALADIDEALAKWFRSLPWVEAHDLAYEADIEEMFNVMARARTRRYSYC